MPPSPSDNAPHTPAPRRPGLRSLLTLPALLILVPTLLHLAILWFRLPVYTRLPEWFWFYTDKPPAPWWLFPTLALIPLATIALLRWPRGWHKSKLAAFILLGLAFQFGLALVDGEGINGVTYRAYFTGHGEFTRAAVRQTDMLYVARNYETLLDEGKLGKFANSKPPGTFLFYLMTYRIAEYFRPFPPGISENHKMVNLGQFGTAFWPVLCYLVLVPTWFLGAMLYDKKTALLTCALYLFAPSVTLVTMHTDQVVYPLLFMTTLFVAALAARRGSLPLAALAGLCFYFALWFTFALLFVLPFVVALTWTLRRRERDPHPLRASLRLALAFAAGAILMDIAFRWGLDYDILVRYRRAVAYHAAWRNWDPSLNPTLMFAALNLFEYAVWLGVPLAILTLAAAQWALGRLFQTGTVHEFGTLNSFPKRRTAGGFLDLGRILVARLTPRNVLPLLLPVVFVALGLVGKAKCEVNRLWLFLVPLTCLVAAAALRRRFRRHPLSLAALVLLLQFATTCLIKLRHDFR